MLMRRQFVLTLILMPITFGIWYAAGTLFAAPAVWLCDLFLSNLIPGPCRDSGTARGGDDSANPVRRDRGRNLTRQGGRQSDRAADQYAPGVLLHCLLRSAASGVESSRRHLQVLYRAFLALGHHGFRSGVDRRQRPAAHSRRPLLKHGWGAARRLSGTHLSIQRAAHAHAGACLPVVLATQRVTPVGGARREHQTRFSYEVASTFRVRPSSADCSAFSIR